jgi:alanyl-tRNA synthetase
MLKIMSESAVAAGVRRIEAVTGSQVEVVIEQLEDQLRAAKEFFENTPNLVNSISKMVRENEAYKKAMEEVDKERIVSLKKAVEEMSTEINGVKVFTLQGSYRPDIVKEVAFRLHSEYKNAAMFAAFQTLDNKPSLLIMYSDDLVQAGANAGKDIKEVAKLVNGGGGGQNFLATAGGKNIDGLAAAMEKMLELISK